MKIGVIGLGYVGLPLVIQFAKSGVSVLGLDIDETKVESINAGESYIRHIPSGEIKVLQKDGKIEASGDFSRVKELDAVLICVPTPLSPDNEPDLSYVLETGNSIAPHLTAGVVVVLESTTYPGTTEDELRPILEKGSRMKAGKDFYLAYSPEREDPGNPQSQVGRVPKVVGGFTPTCCSRAEAIYKVAVETLVPVSSCRVAEASKLLENVFRGVNIALVNELKLVLDEMNIDVWEVIQAASTKPYGFMPFYPGPGLGGHCIPIDPFYLAWKARQSGRETRFIELAGEINSSMPAHVVNQCAKALDDNTKNLTGKRVLVIGLAYKADVDDCRESPALSIMDSLQKRGAHVDYYDPYIPIVPQTRSHATLAGLESVTWEESCISSYDLAIIVTAHSRVNWKQLDDWVGRVVDTRNVMARAGISSQKICKA